MYNKYLQDRARRGRGRGGSSSRGRDRAMDYRDSYPKYDSRRDNRYDSRGMGSDSHYWPQQHGEHHRPSEYEVYGHGITSYRPVHDYAYDMADRDYEKEWKEDLSEWCKELKHYDKFNVNKEQIYQIARQMGVKFEDFSEEEFLTTYYMILSDFDGQLIQSPQLGVTFAIKWLEDADSKLKGSEKLCAYYYEVVKGGE